MLVCSFIFWWRESFWWNEHGMKQPRVGQDFINACDVLSVFCATFIWSSKPYQLKPGCEPYWKSLFDTPISDAVPFEGIVFLFGASFSQYGLSLRFWHLAALSKGDSRKIILLLECIVTKFNHCALPVLKSFYCFHSLYCCCVDYLSALRAKAEFIVCTAMPHSQAFPFLVYMNKLLKNGANPTWQALVVHGDLSF